MHLMYQIKNMKISKIGPLTSHLLDHYISDLGYINRVNLIFYLLKSFKNSYIAINFSFKNIFQIIYFFFNTKHKLSIFKKLNLIYKIFIFIKIVKNLSLEKNV